MKRVGVVLALAALVVLPKMAAAAESWSQVLASETDTVVAFAGDALVRAPFHLASAETLWREPGGEHLNRLRLSSDGTRIAWLSAAGDRSPVTLWVSDPLGTGRVAVFGSVVPSDAGTVRYETRGPTTNDPEVHGARMIEPPIAGRAAATHALAFLPGDDALLFATRDGIGLAPPDTTRARLASRVIAVMLRTLEPAPVVLAEVVRLGPEPGSGRSEGSPFSRDPAGGALPGNPDDAFTGTPTPAVRAELGYYLLYPTAAGLHAFPAAGFDESSPWAASAGTVWWGEGRKLVAVTAGDPTVRALAEDAKPIEWLGWDDARRAVLRAAGSRVTARAESDGAESVVLATRTPIRRVLTDDAERVRALVTTDSLIVWDVATDAREGVALNGVAPQRVFLLRDGSRVVAVNGTNDSIRLLRVAGGKLESLDAPALKNERVAVSPGGGALLLWTGSTKPPATVRVWRVAAPGWIEVENPGLAGWEPVVR